MSDPVIVGTSVAAGVGGTGLVTWLIKRLDLKKQDKELCSERHKAVERRLVEGNDRFKESEARDAAMSKDIFDIKLTMKDIQGDIKQLLKNGSNGNGQG